MDSAKQAQTPEEILAAYASGQRYGVNGQRLPVDTDESIAAHHRALEAAKASQATSLVAHLTYLIGLIHLERFDLHEAQELTKEAANLARELSDTELLAKILGNLSVVEHYLGNGEAAVTQANEAVQVACSLGPTPLSGYLLCSCAAIQCYIGHYPAARDTFAQARATFERAEDELGIAWIQYVFAREYARDQGQFSRAIEQLESAMPTLRENVSSPHLVSALLALADNYIRQGNLKIGSDLIQQADGLITTSKLHWHRPESLLLKAQLATAEKNFKLAARHAYAGLGAAGAFGDLRVLTALYRNLASTLEQESDKPERLDDAYNALERGMSMGRVRARRLDLALTLHCAGQHLKSFATRPTLRARGSGFLFEADGLFKEMGIALPEPVAAKAVGSTVLQTTTGK
jgi:tetratricopeptide (TPR) repeat protein